MKDGQKEIYEHYKKAIGNESMTDEHKSPEERYIFNDEQNLWPDVLGKLVIVLGLAAVLALIFWAFLSIVSKLIGG